MTHALDWFRVTRPCHALLSEEVSRRDGQMNGVDFKPVVELLLGAAQVAILAAVAIGAPVSLGVLAFYRRRILRSMTPKASSTSRTAAEQNSALSTSERALRPPIEWRQLNRAAIDHRAG